MKPGLMIAGGLCLIVAPGLAQNPDPQLTAQTQAVNSLARCLEKSIPAEPGELIVVKSNSRGAQISVLYEFMQRFEGHFQLTPIPRRSRGIPFQSLSQDENFRLKALVEGGFLPSASPLATLNAPLGDADFGDALGWVALRVLELSHDTDLQYSPYLRLPD